MSRNPHSQPNSIKIMDKLKQIKRIFNQGQSIYASNPTAIQSYHQASVYSQNQKLRKYLPESMRREHKEIQDPVLVSPGVEMRHNDHNNFKKQLESKMETLFNEEKSLLRNRYEVSDEEESGRQRKEPVIRMEQRYQNESIVEMDRKVRELEKRYLISKSEHQTSAKPKHKETSRKRSKGRDKDRDNKVSINSEEANQLKQALYQTKLLNQRLSNKLLKQKQKRSLAKDSQILKLTAEIAVLKGEMEKIKSTQQSPYLVCPARVKSRQKSISSFLANQNTAEHSILTQVYGQIEDLQSRLTRQQKERLDLNQKNMWLQSQLQKYTK